MGEVLRLTQSGLLVPVGDAAAFAEAIVRLAGDEGLRAELSRRALEAYQTLFTVETMAAGYMELYRGAGRITFPAIERSGEGAELSACGSARFFCALSSDRPGG